MRPLRSRPCSTACPGAGSPADARGAGDGDRRPAGSPRGLRRVRRRERAGAGWLSAGFEAKVFPGATIPVAAIRIWRLRGPRRLIESAGVFVAVGLAFAGYFLVVAFGGIGFSYYSQVKRGLQIE